MQHYLRLSTVSAFTNVLSKKIKSFLQLSVVLMAAMYSGDLLAQGTTCSTATVINCGENVTSSTTGVPNDNATSGAFTCNTTVGTGGQRWFSLTPTSTGPITISLVETATNYDTKLHLYSGVCGNLTCVAGNDDFDFNNGIDASQLTNIQLQAGTTYLIRVGGYLGLTGVFNLSISSCEGAVIGCTDNTACNFNPSANTSDNSCIYPGCNQPDACNFNAEAGCDDGSCCFATCNQISVTSGIFPGEIGWTVFSPAGLELASGGAPSTGVSVCVTESSCNYTILLTDDFGDGWNGASYTITSPLGVVEATGTLLPDNITDPNPLIQTQELTIALGGAIAGCTNPEASNYNSNATCDNGTCLACGLDQTLLKLVLEDSFGDGWNGASYSLVDNTNTEILTGTLAASDLDSVLTCLETGCYRIDVTNGFFPEEISWSIVDDNGTIVTAGFAGESVIFGWNGAEGCIIEGCTDSTACNFVADANVNDGSCSYPGCTDAAACNFNASAFCDNGSCCFNSCVNVVVTSGEFPGEIGWQLLDTDQSLIAEGGAPADQNICLATPLCGGQLQLFDGFGDGWNDATYTFTYEGVIQATGTLDANLDFNQVLINLGGNLIGCTDPDAVNFDALATCDNASCIYSGCTDFSACNFDLNASVDNGSCIYPGCTDAQACNFNSNAGCDDLSCTYADPFLACDGSCLNDSDADGVCNELEIVGCQNELACNYDAAATDAGTCNLPEPFLDCDGNCINDTDLDGVCNELEVLGCTDATACNYNADATDNDASCVFPAAFTDCSGNCINDINSNDICDENEVGGCTDVLACNFDSEANTDNGSCTYPGCSDPAACNYFEGSGCADGSCEYPGCIISNACNFNELASCDDGSCVFPGCLDITACNYDDNAACSGDCIFAAEFLDCAGNCINDLDNDGICDELEIPGCTDLSACNFNASATDDNGTCEYPLEFLDCNGNCLADIDNDGICDALDQEGCTDATACNWNSNATVNDGSCVYPGCSDPDACNYNPSAGCSNGTCEFPGCPISFACNYNPDAICFDELVCVGEPGSPCDDGNPLTNGEIYDDNCNCGVPVSITIFDIVAGSEVHTTLESALLASGLDAVFSEPGAYTLFAPTDAAFGALPAGTIDALLADPNGALTEILLYHTVDGVALSTDLEDGLLVPTLQGQNVLVTINNNGVFINDAQVIVADLIADNGVVHVIDGVLLPNLTVEGCTDITACNYSQNATADDGSCLYGGCTIIEACNYDISAVCADNALCTFGGCLDITACNFNPDAACEDGSCIFPEPFEDCNGNCLNDADLDLICDELEISGCNDVFACNYNPAATENDNSCTYSESEFVDCNGVCYFDSDGDGICDAFEVDGCTDFTACNYNPFAQDDDGSCTYPGCADVTACNFDSNAACDDGTCVFPGCTVFPSCNYDPSAGCDDGSCEFGGCTDTAACNYDAAVSCNDGSCFFDSPYEDCDGVCYNDTNENGICDEYEIPGCTDPAACNFNPIALFDNGLCTYPGCADPEACNYVGFVGCPDESCIYPGCTDEFACNFNPLTICDDGSCAYPGCTDETACNYDPFAGCNGFNCIQANFPFNCDGICVNDIDLDEVCDENEVAGCEDVSACNYNPEATDDNGTCEYPLAFLNCDGTCIDDQDGDGICDNLDLEGCIDTLACNFNAFALTSDNSCVYPGCTEITACNYNPLAGCQDESCVFPQIFQDCFGNCINDIDNNQICDELEQPGCTDETACNYDPFAASDDGSCSYPGCTDNIACNFNEASACDDGSCVYPGCIIPEACNYDATAQCDDGLCEFPGCFNETACNFDPSAGCSDEATCLFPDTFYDCFGTCINDIDGDLVCDELEIVGCLDPQACNYNELSTDLVSCVFPLEYYNCDGNCIADSDNDGICNELDAQGCTDVTACNYNPFANIDDNSCTYPGCADTSACNYQIEAACDDGSCVFPGCMDNIACNYDANALCDGGECVFPSCGDIAACNYDATYQCGLDIDLCVYPDQYYNCEGQCINDSDLDGVCDSLEITGCTDIIACNYNPNATETTNDCTYPEQYYNCDGICIDDADQDGICDIFDLVGCTDPTACNFNEFALDSDNSCVYPGCTDVTACNFNEAAACDDQSCIDSGCLDSLACNYNPNAGCDNGECAFPACIDPTACNYAIDALCGDGSLCQYPEPFLNCDGFCIDDQDSDGICDPFDIQGCTDSSACNFNPFALDLDNSCVYASEYYNCNGICLNDEDGDGVCNELEVSGCTDFAACNFDPFATEEDSTCSYPELYYDCNGVCLQDADNDGICDPLDNTGCTDSTACDFNEFATINTGLCTYAAEYYNCSGNCINDADGDGVCDELEVIGCIIPDACNFDPQATDYDSSCVFPGCTDLNACNYDPTAGCDNNSCYSPLPGFLCDGTCDGDADGDGLCDFFETNGCTDVMACNYNPYATVNDLTCAYPGCTDATACNFDPAAGCPLEGACEFPVTYYNCDGSCISDVDADGICDPFETTGCTDPSACNYNEFVTIDDGSCSEQIFVTESITVTSDSFPLGYEWNGALLQTSGEYIWVGTSANGCDSVVTLTFEYIVVIAVNDDLASINVNIYPNPAKDLLNISTMNGEVIDQVDLFDLQGKMVVQDRNVTVLDVSLLDAGVYVLRIRTGQNTLHKRIEVVK